MFNKYADRTESYTRVDFGPQTSGRMHARPTHPPQRAAAPGGIDALLSSFLPRDVDSGDILLLLLFWFLYQESHDEEFLIILIVVAISVFKIELPFLTGA